MTVSEGLQHFLSIFRKSIKEVKENEFNEGAVQEKSPQEEAALLQQMKREIQDNSHSDEYLIMFVRARKYNVEQATRSFTEYHDFLKEEGLDKPNYYKIKEVLQTGVFLHLDSYDKKGRAVLIVRLRYFDPKKIEIQHMLQTIIFLLHQILMKPSQGDARRAAANQLKGIVVLQDMRELSISNINPRLGPKVVKTLQNKFPCRFGGIIVYQAPYFLRSIFAVIKPLLKKKLNDRILSTTQQQELLEHIDKEHLPVELGGEKKYDVASIVAKLCDQPEFK